LNALGESGIACAHVASRVRDGAHTLDCDTSGVVIACTLLAVVASFRALFGHENATIQRIAIVGVCLANVRDASDVDVDARGIFSTSAVASVVGANVIVVAKTGNEGVVALGSTSHALVGISSARVVVVTCYWLCNAVTSGGVANCRVASSTANLRGVRALGSSRNSAASVVGARVAIIAINGLGLAFSGEGIAALRVARIGIVTQDGGEIARVVS